MQRREINAAAGATTTGGLRGVIAGRKSMTQREKQMTICLFVFQVVLRVQ